jgi:PIN domain nuclease of toxin-antitoxin system
MAYLLDTHGLLWVLFSPGKLSPTVRKVIENSRQPVGVSSVSFWEISIKTTLGRLSLPQTSPEELPSVTRELGLEIIEPSADLFASFHRLPLSEHHRDPFDRLLIWTALRKGYTLISKDRRMSEYKSQGLQLLW